MFFSHVLDWKNTFANSHKYKVFGKIHLPIVTNIKYIEFIFVILLYKTLIWRIDYTTCWESMVCT